MIKIKIINKTNNPNPYYQTTGSDYVDLMAFTEEDIVLKPNEPKIVPTGLYMKIPEGYEGIIKPRISLFKNYGVTVLGTPLTINFNYNKEIKILLINLAKHSYVVKNGEKIAQMAFEKPERAIFAEVKELN